MEEKKPTPQQLRHDVVTAAMDEFRIRGIKSVTMDDIAHRLTMSKRTLYQLFADKETLILACLREKDEEEVRLYEKIQAETDNVLEIILRMFDTCLREMGDFNPVFFSDLGKYPRVVEHHLQRRASRVKSGREFLRRGVEQGLFRAETDYDIILPLMVESIDTLVCHETFRNLPLRRLFLNTQMVMLRGCTTPEGMRKMDEFLDRWDKEEQSGRG